MRLRSMVTGDRGHDVYPGLGPLNGGNTLLPARLILMNMIFLVPQVLMRKFIMMIAFLLFMMIILMKVDLERS